MIMTAKTGDRVSVHYTGKFEDGIVFDSSSDRDPIQFEVGGSDLIPGIAEGVAGMAVGDERTLRIPPDRGYGERNEALQNVVDRKLIPEEAEVGDQLLAQSDETRFPVWVRDLTDDTATLDRNHPLAGVTLIFDVTLVSIEQAQGPDSEVL
jgi:peptidylprolyl isomerase